MPSRCKIFVTTLNLVGLYTPELPLLHFTADPMQQIIWSQDGRLKDVASATVNQIAHTLPDIEHTTCDVMLGSCTELILRKSRRGTC
jgi:hypothetical protein